MWAYAAIIGTGVHQMIDFPVMMPANALSTLAVLSLALPPQQVIGDRRAAWIIALAAAVLIIVGIRAAPLRIT